MVVRDAAHHPAGVKSKIYQSSTREDQGKEAVPRKGAPKEAFQLFNWSVRRMYRSGNEITLLDIFDGGALKYRRHYGVVPTSTSAETILSTQNNI